MNTQTSNFIPQFDLKRQYEEIKEEIDQAVAGVLLKGNFILGEEVEKFEDDFAHYLNVGYGIGVASGTEALQLAMMALGVGPGDEVITVPNTAVPTVSAISLTGATPVFVDIDGRTGLMDVSLVENAITHKTKTIIPVHLYGNCVEMDPLVQIAKKKGLSIIEDACQAHGAEYKGKKVGTIGDIGAFSFYPTKNLGAYGDAGMVVTDNKTLAEKLKLLRIYGMTDRSSYRHEIKGMNSRMDEIQAAVLNVKLKYLDKWNTRRREIAFVYNQILTELELSLPKETACSKSVYHQYAIKTKHREEIQKYLSSHKIGTAVHYPISAHLQPAYCELRYREGSFPMAELWAEQTLSLPMYPELSMNEIHLIGRTITDCIKGK